MNIGVIKETAPGETRVALVPVVAAKLLKKGFRILLEAGAGEPASFHDAVYEETGVELVSRSKALESDIVLGLGKPVVDVVEGINENAILICHTENCEDDGTLASLIRKHVKVIAMERIPRISRAQSMDALSSQSNIAGYRAVLEAAVQYSEMLPLMMTSAGSSKPARVVVLGAGVAGLQAIATARRLGADVYAYDIRPETKEQIESLGAKAIVLDIGESGVGQGGYAKELTDDAKAKEKALLADELAKARIIISTALIPCRPAPVLIPEDVVKRMQEGSVIIDLAAPTGGNCPLTELNKVVIKHGVTIAGYANYAAMVAADASMFYANNIFHLLDIMFEQTEDGPVLRELHEDEITKAALVSEA